MRKPEDSIREALETDRNARGALLRLIEVVETLTAEKRELNRRILLALEELDTNTDDDTALRRDLRLFLEGR